MNMHLSNGTILKGSYKIIRFIAAGGFGCTYEAEHIMLGKHVAIKEFFIADFCNRDATTSQISVGVDSKKALVAKLKSKFIDEARAIARMSHPNIISVSDVFEDNGTAYYVMDYIDGKSLAHIVLERGRLSEQDSLRIIKTVSSALKYVHSQNRLHLDIKPANIMVRRDGNVFLIDFGVSKQYDEIDGQNTSTLMGYSSGYAPVEQMSNRVKNFTPATDIYALGATFYTLLTGIMPPVDSTDRADEDTLSPLPSSISAPVRSAIEKAMNVSRSGRIQSIAEFLSIINNGINHSETKADSPNPSYHIEQPFNARRDLVTYIDGHECVDLGLPSKTKWAICNIGANKPEDNGQFFAWGKTLPNRGSSAFAAGLKFMLKIGSNEDITSKCDAATHHWGYNWQIPSNEQFQELIQNTNSTWINQNGVFGRLLISKINGEKLFLPAAGHLDGAILEGKNRYGNYWSSTAKKDCGNAFMLTFGPERFNLDSQGRDIACSIRPVSK